MRNIFTWYFAYGSNMDADRMRKRIKRLPERVPGVLKDWQLAFNKMAERTPGKGYANIVPSPGDAVEGVLYPVTEEELQALDRYEDVPRHYEHCRVEVVRRDTGETVTAIAYVAHPKQVRDGLRPTREYLGHLLAGADCLSEEYARGLRTVETLD